MGVCTHLPMIEPKREFHEALRILNRYYDEVAKQMADEIIEHAEDFESPGVGQAEAVVEKYALRLRELGCVYSILRWAAFRKKPEASEPIGKNEFRCFGCGAVIHSDDQACPVCGWTWK